MKHIFAFENKQEYERFEKSIERFKEKLEDYQNILEEKFALNDLPRGIVWTSEGLATTDVPIPAFTNKDTICFSPDLTAWRRLFVSQLEDKENPEIQTYYEQLSENQLFTIIAHELTHHSDLFVDEFDSEREDSIWFEEGMCDYLARKHMLSEAEFDEITYVESQMVDIFKDRYGGHSLDEFGTESYQGSLTGIMFDYWRSFLSIKYLVEEKAENDIDLVFQEYHNWHEEGRKVPLTEYLKTPLYLNN